MVAGDRNEGEGIGGLILEKSRPSEDTSESIGRGPAS